MRRTIGLFVVILVVIGGAATGQDTESGLVLHYTFDDDAAPGTDDSGNGNDALVNGAPIGVDGPVDGAIEYGGGNLYVDSELGSYGNLSVAVWVNLPALTNNFHTILNCDAWDPSDLHFQIVRNTGAIRFSVNANAPIDMDSVFAFAPSELNQWIHVAAVYDSALGTVDFYVNGQPDVQRFYTTAGPIVLGPLTVGAWNQTTRQFVGAMDDLRIYERSLFAEDVEALFDEGSIPDEPPEFLNIPNQDSAVPGTLYSRQITVRGQPDPTVTVIEPAGASISETGLFTYDVPDPAPDSFVVTLEADNGVGDPVRASWTVVRAGLGGLWCLEEGAGLLAEDSVGEADADLVGMDDSAWIEGRISENALAFDGVDDYLLLAPEGEAMLDFHSDFTWAAWVNTTAGGTIFAKCPTLDVWARGAMALFIRNGQLAFDVGWVGVATATGTVANGQWHHVAVTVRFDVNGVNDELQLFIDGVPDTLRNNWDIEEQGPPPGDFKAGFASSNFPAVPYLNGALDELHVWNYALTADEVLEVSDNPGAECGGIFSEAPAIVDAPEDDVAFKGRLYSRSLTITGFPTPTVTVESPAFATFVNGVLSYDTNMEAPDSESFEVRLTASNGIGDDAMATWEVSLIELPALAALWQFNDDPASDVAVDSSVAGNDAALSGDATFADDSAADPDRGGVIRVEGGGWLATNKFITELGDANFSYAAWIKTTQAGGVILSKQNNDANWQRAEKKYYISPGGGDNGGSPPGGVSMVGHSCDWVTAGLTAPIVNDGDWHHLVMTVDRSLVGMGPGQIYIDGWLVTDYAKQGFNGRADNAADTVYIGRTPGGENTQNFIGLMDDVAIFTVVLTPDQVLAIMDGDYSEFSGEPGPCGVSVECAVTDDEPAQLSVSVSIRQAGACECEVLEVTLDGEPLAAITVDNLSAVVPLPSPCDPGSEHTITARCTMGGDGGREASCTFNCPEQVGTPFVRGDSNADGSRNITDGVFIFSFLFTGGQEPPCKDAADTSDQGSINITSGIYILNFLFLGGPEPPAPFPECGEDPTPEATELGCESFAPCEP